MKIAVDHIAQGSVPTQRQSRLLALPAELRTQICGYTLTGPPNRNGRLVIGRNLKKDEAESPKSSDLALLQTCRLVHGEAAGMFCDQKHLELALSKRFSAEKNFKMFLGTLSPPRLNTLRALTFDVDDMFQAFCLLSSIQETRRMHNLQKTTIKLNGQIWNGDDVLLHMRVTSWVLKGVAEKLESIKELAFDFECELEPPQRQRAMDYARGTVKCLPAELMREEEEEEEEEEEAEIEEKMGAVLL